jgi:hypothetical protein
MAGRTLTDVISHALVDLEAHQECVVVPVDGVESERLVDMIHTHRFETVNSPRGQVPGQSP